MSLTASSQQTAVELRYSVPGRVRLYRIVRTNAVFCATSIARTMYFAWQKLVFLAVLRFESAMVESTADARGRTAKLAELGPREGLLPWSGC